MIAHPGIPLAGRWNWPYLNTMPVSAPYLATTAASQGRLASAIVWGAGLLGATALVAAAALWFHYGTTVFFEMIAAGISACF